MLPVSKNRIISQQDHTMPHPGLDLPGALGLLSREQQLLALQRSRQHRATQSVSPVANIHQHQSLQPLLSHNISPADVVGEAARSQLIRLLVLRDQEDALKRQYRELILQQVRLTAAAPTANKLCTSVHTTNVLRQSLMVSPTENLESSSDNEGADLPEPPMKKFRLAQKPKKKRKDDDEGKPKKKDAKWLATLEKLKEYKKVHGNCVVPRGFSPDPRLASWVAEQR